MSAVDDVVDALIAGGMSPGAAASMVARAGAELSVAAPSKAAARTRKWRAKKASQTVTERHAVTVPAQDDEASQNVTNRHGDVTGDAAHISILSSASENEESPKEVKKIEAPREKRASRIPADWHLDQRHVDYAISKGIVPERIPDLGEKFKNHWLAASGKGSVSPNWFLKWCTWVMNDVEWNGAKNGTRSHNPARRSGADDFFAGIAEVAADIGRDGAVARPADEDIPRGRFEFDAEPARRN